MKSTSPITLILAAVAGGILGGGYGQYQVSHGHSFPVAHPSSLVTMPAIGLILLALAWPVIRYRRQLLQQAKATTATSRQVPRPKRLDPFYAVRVLLLAKSTEVAAAAMGGFHLGLVILQLTSPIIPQNVWLNISGVLGSVFALIVGVVVEKFCKIPGDSIDSATSEAAA